MKHCKICGHSRAAHLDRRCAFCGCRLQRLDFVQDSFAFREALPSRTAPGKGKRE